MGRAKVSDHFLERLRAWGATHVFGYPGDGINGLPAAWSRAGDEPRFLQARHEEMAAFEAVGYAKFSGHVGLCGATYGPGAIHLCTGLRRTRTRWSPPASTSAAGHPCPTHAPSNALPKCGGRLALRAGQRRADGGNRADGSEANRAVTDASPVNTSRSPTWPPRSKEPPANRCATGP